jgi:hypothetical protein
VLAFEADDPYWYDVLETTQSWGLGGTIPKWFDPGTSKRILPVQLAASSLGGGGTSALAIDVDGQVQTWPTWTLYGAAATVVVDNETTGKSFALDAGLAAGDVLELDTRPGIKTVLKNGAAAFSLLTAWDLFPLVPGDNAINVTITGADANTELVAAWRPAWLGY